MNIDVWGARWTKPKNRKTSLVLGSLEKLGTKQPRGYRLLPLGTKRSEIAREERRGQKGFQDIANLQKSNMASTKGGKGSARRQMKICSGEQRSVADVAGGLRKEKRFKQILKKKGILHGRGRVKMVKMLRAHQKKGLLYECR